jgi:cell division protein FtsQ
MSSAPARKRRRRASPVHRLRPFWFLLIVLVALGATGTYLLLSWPALDPHTIDVTGNHVVSRGEIIDRARINAAQNMWLQSTGAMTARIEAIPYIDQAYVHRVPPDTIAIATTERTPHAVVRSGAGEVTVDSTLRVLQDGAASPSLPVLEEPGVVLAVPGSAFVQAAVSELAGVLDHAQTAGLSVAALGYDRFGDVTITLRSGVRVLIGDETDLDKKLALVEPILTQAAHGRRITTVDLRALTTPVVEYAAKR